MSTASCRFIGVVEEYEEDRGGRERTLEAFLFTEDVSKRGGKGHSEGEQPLRPQKETLLGQEESQSTGR
jgi:hypothetical protein